jgi:hypothetical protein
VGKPPAEPDDLVAELLALLVVHELVAVALLEAGEALLLGANWKRSGAARRGWRISSATGTRCSRPTPT